MNCMERNEKGQGTVFQRGDKFVGRLRYKDELHNQQEKSFTCKTEEEAWKKLEAFRKSLAKGDVPAGKDLPFGDWLKLAMDTIYRGKLRPNTFTLYQGFIDYHLKPLAKVPLNKLTPNMCDTLISGLKKIERSYEKGADGKIVVNMKQELPLSGQTKTLVRRFLIGNLNHAVRLGYLKENPAMKSLPPLKVATRQRVLTKAETIKLLAVTENPLYKAMFSFQILLGLRIGEVLGIKWADLEEVDGSVILHIRQQMQRNRQEKRVMAAELKTEQARRSLELPEDLVKLLRAIEVRGEFVFSTSNNTPLEPRNAQRALEAHAKRAGLGHLTTHSLRRTSATLHLLAGTGLGILKDILGHTDIRTTTLYAKSSLAANRDANERMKNLLG